MKKQIKKLLKKFNPSWILRFIPDEPFLKIKYRVKTGKKLNLRDPQTFTEKIQWIKLNDHNPQYSKMVDKYDAKEYVEHLIGSQYIIPNLGVWDDADQIDFAALPQQFVIKCTHDSGGLIICQDKSKLDIEASKVLLKRCMKRNWYYFSREYAYRSVKSRIIAEEYLENDSREGLHDYKVWCFNGEPRYIQYVTGRIGAHTYEGFYDLNWNLQDFTYHNPKVQVDIPKPACLDELIDVSRKVSQGTAFLRADFYVLQDQSIRFGELTFYPNGGFDVWTPVETDSMMGNLLLLK